MANPLDTDAGTELFTSYETDFKLVHADITQQLDQIAALSAEPRKAAISQAERAVEEAQELVRHLFPSLVSPVFCYSLRQSHIHPHAYPQLPRKAD